MEKSRHGVARGPATAIAGEHNTVQPEGRLDADTAMWAGEQANGSLVSKKSHGVTYLRDLPLVKVQNAESPVGFCFFLAQVIEDLWEEAP